MNTHNDSNKNKEEAEQEKDETAHKSQEELEKAQQQIEQLTEAAKRSMADLQNYKKRAEEERKEFARFASANVFMEILPVFDSFERAQEHMPKAIRDNEWVKGIQSIIKQFEQIMDKFHIKKMKTVGEKFNPNKHEAMAQGPGEKDVIINELEAGYEMDGHTLRAAKVRVGDGTTENDQKNDHNAEKE
ncbi:nucleotide exchange factor GrpE [Candidatus Peregrinibacteria bacterium]|nr:nucleotide exchange factor GrpE [Candidatus Peregrinibacteria bacterium]